MLLVACSSSEAPDGPTPCGSNGSCPAGYTCEPTTHLCIVSGGSPDAQPAAGASDALANDSFCAGMPTTIHQTPITGAETWTADTSHYVAATVQVAGTLTIAAGAEVCLEFDVTLVATAGGRVVAEGTTAQPIHIASMARSSNTFGALAANAGGTLRLAHVLLDSSGGVRSTDGTVGIVQILGPGYGQPRQPIISVEDVTIRDAPAVGVTAFGGATFSADSSGLIISGAASYPIAVEPRTADGLPEGSYTGNGHDAILVTHNIDPISESTTFHDRGVPYDLADAELDSAGSLLVRTDGGPLVTLAFEPGVTVRFPPLGTLNVVGATAANGPTALLAVGTADRPIVFTSASATPAAGDWKGLLFLNAVDPASQIANVRVEYAGGGGHYSPSSCPLGEPDGAIEIAALPASELITQTTIAHSAGHGIVRSWASATKTDFLATNTFSDVALCNESWPADADGTCPASPACPR